MVQSWLVHSTVLTISNSIPWITSARKIWEDLQDRFSQKNAPQIYEICHNIYNHSQGTNSISAYYTVLKGYYDELASYQTPPTCSCGAMTTITKHLESKNLTDFLQGLNDSYSIV